MVNKRPKLTRYNSVFKGAPGGTLQEKLQERMGERYGPGGRRYWAPPTDADDEGGFVPGGPTGPPSNRYIPGKGYSLPQPMPEQPDAEGASDPGSDDWFGDYIEDQLPPHYVERQTLNAERWDGTADGAAAGHEAAEAASIFAPLDTNLNPNATFVFEYGAPMTNLETGKRDIGSPFHDGFFSDLGSVFLPGANAGGKLPKNNTNMMSVAGVVKWLRGLSVRDKGAYNKLIVMLRNAGYINGADEELPLNGYSTDAGIAIATAANDLSQANEAGDTRSLMDYLTDRGKGLADYLAEQEADQAKEDQYKPIDRQYQDPASIRAAAYDAARAAIGRKLTDEEEARFEAAFRGRENSFYDQLDTARQNETKFAAYAPDVAGQADAFIGGDDFDTERVAERIRQYGEAFLGLMQ